MSNDYKPVIGMEIHVQLKTKSKMFSPAPNDPNAAEPNINIDEIITGQPGTLPVINKEAIRLGIMAGMALNCQIDEYSKFDRKHYFYPDLPKGYQISQYDQPIARDGWVEIQIPLSASPPHEEGQGEVIDSSTTMTPSNSPASPSLGRSGPSRGGEYRTKRIRIHRAHLEEDAGKNIHPAGLPYSLVDYNRAGAPLLEIVTEPDIESGEEARLFLQALRNIVRYVGASDADMEKGTMRCEPNISVKKPGEEKLPNYKVEVKNLNSFRFVEMAINYEIKRQIDILADEGRPRQVTMGWNEKTNSTVEQRSKEEAHDYRYFPEPDLPILHFTEEYLDELRQSMPELPSAKERRFIEEYHLPEKDVETLINDKYLAAYFEQAVSELQEWFNNDHAQGDLKKLAKLASNWISGDFQALLKTANIRPGDSRVTAENLAELIKMIDRGEISTTAGKKVLQVMFDKGGDPSNIVQDEGLAQVSDESALFAAIDKVLAENEKVVADYKNGKQQALGFLVGKVMAETKGKANPQLVNELLSKKLK